MNSGSSTVLPVVTFLVILTFLCYSNVEAFPRCEQCTERTCPTPVNCKYGIVRDFCGREVCAKGPGHRCGGKWDYHGTCGDGMFCSCGRCSGCSIHTLECRTSSC